MPEKLSQWGAPDKWFVSLIRPLRLLPMAVFIQRLNANVQHKTKGIDHTCGPRATQEKLPEGIKVVHQAIFGSFHDVS